MAFTSSVDAGIAQLVFNKPPVNAFNSAEWAGIAAEINRSASATTSLSLLCGLRARASAPV